MLRADKKLGQHFLTDQKVINQITSDFAEHAQQILEVGPGTGVLTRKLDHKRLTVIEKDQRFKNLLQEYLSPTQIVIADALEVDLSSLIKPGCWLVSNLPYNISTVLLVKFLPLANIHFMTLMFQKEVGEKLISKKMNSLMALANNYFSLKLLCKIPPGAFSPPPQVDSVVISFERIPTPELPVTQFSHYERFLKKLFSGKRKQLLTTLKPFYSKELLLPIFEKTQITPTLRAEALNLQQVRLLYRELEG